MGTCKDCPKPLKHLVLVVSAYGVQLCVDCYIKRLEARYSCPKCKQPFKARERTEVIGGVVVHEKCP